MVSIMHLNWSIVRDLYCLWAACPCLSWSAVVMRVLICRWLRINMQHFFYYTQLYYYTCKTAWSSHVSSTFVWPADSGIPTTGLIVLQSHEWVGRQLWTKKKKIMPRKTDPRAADRLPAHAIQDKAIRAGSPACEQSPTGPICRKGESRRRS